MEEVRLAAYIHEQSGTRGGDLKTYSPLTLAFIGDSIYDLVIKTLVVGRGNRAPEGLHKMTSSLVKAGVQAKMAEQLFPLLTEEEQGIYRRGRNAKSYTTAKNASVSEYRRATGFEALAGYLYLSNRMGRLLELIEDGMKMIGCDYLLGDGQVAED